MVGNKTVERTKSPKSQHPAELPPFDDLLDVLQFVDSNDLGDYLDSFEEISPEQFEADKKRRRAEGTVLPRDKRKLIGIGETIRERLLLLGMRQADLARKLRVNRSWVTRVVQGRENLTIAKLCDLAEGLECDESYLLREPPLDEPIPISQEPTKYKREVALAPKTSLKTRSNVRGAAAKRRSPSSEKIPALNE